MTVPWIELGGNVTINCPKTGYHAEIDFLTKPFYGGKRNKIQGEIYAPNEKKSFLSIYGEWSGLMEAKWNDGTKSKAEVFVDVNRIPIFKKQVRSVLEQDEFESRRIWREVTAGLKWVCFGFHYVALANICLALTPNYPQISFSSSILTR